MAKGIPPAESGPRGLRIGFTAAWGRGSGAEARGGDEGPRTSAGGLAAFDELPKMRSRAARYSASRSASDFCCASAEGVADGDGLVGADGRFRIRSDGCSASTGAAADAADVEEMTSSGIGAFLFLNGAVGSREGVLGPLLAHGGASAADSATNRGGSAGCYSRVLPDLLRVVLVIVVIVPVVLYRLGLPVPLQNDSLELCLAY